MECYYDQAFIAVRDRAAESSLRVTTLPVARAVLGYRGYTREVSPDGRQPLLYDYDYVDPAPLARFSGKLTRYGDVARLLQIGRRPALPGRAGRRGPGRIRRGGLPALPAGLDAQLRPASLRLLQGRRPVHGGQRHGRAARRGAACRRSRSTARSRGRPIRRTSRTFARIKPALPEESVLDESRSICVALFLMRCFSARPRAPMSPGRLIRSARNGRWSERGDLGRRPSPQARASGSRCGPDMSSFMTSRRRSRSARSTSPDTSLRPRRDTRLDVGLIKIQAGDDPGESGFDCEAHVTGGRRRKAERGVLEVGTADHPIARGTHGAHPAALVEGLDPENCPAIVCCGGRMDFHGAELSRTWVKLGAAAAKGSTAVMLAEPVTGWRVGDRVILTATHRQKVPDDGKVPGASHRARDRGAHHPLDRRERD